MKRFSFPLERVRRWREDQVELEEIRLQNGYRDLRAVEAEQIRVAEETERSCREILAKPSIPAGELSLLEDYRLWGMRENRRLAASKAELEKGIREQKQRLLEAHRRFKLLNGLRDKALVSWTAARDKEQEDLAAELYLAKRHRDE